jgi:tRNA G18 (ribose-2'-O)-methylase SpoU
MTDDMVITSRQNPLVKDLYRISTGRGVKRLRKTLVSGRRMVEETIRELPDQLEAWITAGPDMKAPPSGLAHHRLSPEIFREIDVFGTHGPLLLVRTPRPGIWNPAEGLPPGMSVLVPFQDPENVGAVIRSAAAFEVDRVILLEESAHPFHPKTIRASGGTVLRVPLFTGPSLSDIPTDLPLTPLSQEGADIAGHRFSDPCGLLPGLEGPGLPSVWRGRSISIPMSRDVDSLNASAGVAIALYVWAHQRREKT